MRLIAERSSDPADRRNELLETPSALGHRFPLRKAYELCLKCSHLFNILDARGAISVTERVAVIARVRKLAVGVAQAWMEQNAPAEVAAA